MHAMPSPRGGQVADLTTRFPGCMQSGNLDAIIKIELVISLAYRNSGLYRCCTSFVNLGRELMA